MTELVNSTTGAPVADGAWVAAGIKMTPVLVGIPRCPHCSRSTPTLNMAWLSPTTGTVRGDGGRASKWAAYACSSCGGMVLAMGAPGSNIGNSSEANVAAIFPRPRSVSDQLPSVAKTFLRQAVETLHAPDAAAVMAGAAVDAMLKTKGYTDGSLYARIDKAKNDALLTSGMADWAHSVRLGSNRPRHADMDSPHVSPADAKRSVDFAEALGNFLFVLTAQIEEAVNEVSPAQ